MDFKVKKEETLLGHNQRITILGVTIDVLTENQTVQLVEQYVLNKEPLHLIGVNADKINQIQKNNELKNIVNNCGVINADGASVVLASKFLNKSLPERVAGIDLMQSLISLSADKGYTVYLLGAEKAVVENAARILKEENPNLRLVGIHDGYFKKSDWKTIATILKKANPDFVFVGITSPMKEYLVEYLQNEGIRSVFMGIGGSFDVISGKIPRAPQWMQKYNLEWLFRVSQEPKRLFKRYFFGNTMFIKNVLIEKLKERH